MSENPREKSEADAELEREVRAERKFTLSEAIGRLPLFLEVRPLAEHAAPFDVGLADEFLQALVGAEDAADPRG